MQLTGLYADEFLPRLSCLKLFAHYNNHELVLVAVDDTSIERFVVAKRKRKFLTASQVRGSIHHRTKVGEVEQAVILKKTNKRNWIKCKNSQDTAQVENVIMTQIWRRQSHPVPRVDDCTRFYRPLIEAQRS